eukprot:COSAG02_NODE_34460_length_483_cov_22703.356771_1_plen_93_part_01
MGQAVSIRRPRQRLRQIDRTSGITDSGAVVDIVDQAGWCRMPQHAAHPNGSISEQIEAVGASPDPVVYQSNSTGHIDIDCWHTEQIAAATAVG